MPGTKRKRGEHTTSKTAAKDDKPIYEYWLMKSEPESRFEKGVDVKFGLEDLKTNQIRQLFGTVSGIIKPEIT